MSSHRLQLCRWRELPQKFEESIQHLLDQQQQLLKECEESNLPVISADAIRTLPPEEQLKRSVEEFCQQWKELEEMNGITNLSTAPQGCRKAGHLIIPLDTRRGEHGATAAADGDYAMKLQQLIESNISNSQPSKDHYMVRKRKTKKADDAIIKVKEAASCGMKRTATWASGEHDNTLIPELNHPNESTAEHFGYRFWRNNGDGPADVLYSFTVFSVSQPFYRQRLDLSEDQTLTDLQRALDCPSCSKHIEEADGFFFIAGKFYVAADLENIGAVPDDADTVTDNVQLRKARQCAYKNTIRIIRSLHQWLQNNHNTLSKAASVVNRAQSSTGITSSGANPSETTQNTAEQLQHSTAPQRPLREATSPLPCTMSDGLIFPIHHRIDPIDHSRGKKTAIAKKLTMNSMELTKLKSLKNLQLGDNLVYVHAQGCEHVMVLSDVKLSQQTRSSSHPTDHSTSGEADDMIPPVQTYSMKKKVRICDICKLLAAKHVVFDDRLTDTNPTLFCQYCYHLLHYNEEGELLYDDFHVFPYTEDV